jgi:hypothetical protein
LEILFAPPARDEAAATDCLVNLKRENPVEHLGEARASQRDRLNEHEAHPSGLCRSARLTDQLARHWPLQLFKAGHHCRISKRPFSKDLCVKASVYAACIRNGGDNRIAKWCIGRTGCTQKRININVLYRPADGLLQLGARD